MTPERREKIIEALKLRMSSPIWEQSSFDAILGAGLVSVYGPPPPGSKFEHIDAIFESLVDAIEPFFDEITS